MFFSRQIHLLIKATGWRHWSGWQTAFAEPKWYTEYIKLAALPPFMQIENKMMRHITFEHMTAMSLINNDERKRWEETGVTHFTLTWMMLILVSFSEHQWACVHVFYYLANCSLPSSLCCSVPSSLFSGVWGHHQGWTIWSYLVSRLPSSIRTQPALHVEHRSCTWKHHQVWTTLFVSFFLSL